MTDTFDYIQQNILPYRTKTVVQLTGVATVPSDCVLTSGEKLEIETTTYLYYPHVAVDNIGYNSTVYDDDDRNPSTLPVVGVYGFDYEAQPPNTTIDPTTGASIDINEVNGLVSNTISNALILNTTT